MKKIALAAAILASSTTQAQDTSTSHFTENVQAFGNCSVFDQVDMLTDKVSHFLQCLESTFTDKTEIVFVMAEDGRCSVMLSKGVQFVLEETAEVAVRVDRGQLRRGSWQYDAASNYAMLSNDRATFDALLAEISAGERVIMQVAAESGNILFDDSTGAVQEFRRRFDGG